MLPSIQYANGKAELQVNILLGGQSFPVARVERQQGGLWAAWTHDGSGRFERMAQTFRTRDAAKDALETHVTDMHDKFAVSALLGMRITRVAA